VSKIITEYPHFFTATILGWKKLLKPDKYKDILIESMQFLATHQRYDHLWLCHHDKPHPCNLANECRSKEIFFYAVVGVRV
jgi:hypothetical protein